MASLLLISIFVLNVGMPLCNLKQLQFSNRITTLISILGVCLSILVISFGDSYAAYLIIYGIFFGLFIGFGYLAPIKNCYLHIPHLKGNIYETQVIPHTLRSLQRSLHPWIRHLFTTLQYDPSCTYQPQQYLQYRDDRRKEDLSSRSCQ